MKKETITLNEEQLTKLIREATINYINENSEDELFNGLKNVFGRGAEAAKNYGQQKMQQAKEFGQQKMQQAKDFGNGIAKDYHEGEANGYKQKMIQQINSVKEQVRKEEQQKINNIIANYNSQAQKAGMETIGRIYFDIVLRGEGAKQLGLVKSRAQNQGAQMGQVAESKFDANLDKIIRESIKKYV